MNVQTRSSTKHPGRRRFLTYSLAILILFSACSPPVGVQPTVTGWQAQRYLLFDKVWASISSASSLDLLDNTWKSVLANGYVSTDAAGQAKMKKGSSCIVYVFQKSGFLVTEEVISTCPKGSGSSGCSNVSTATLQNCGIRVATLPAGVTFKGTLVTLVDYQELETVVVFTSEGVATITPHEDAALSFDLAPDQAGYWVTPEYREQAMSVFGFEPGMPVDFGRMAAPVESLGLIDQLRSANLVLKSQGRPLIPVVMPYRLGLSWYDPAFDVGSLPDVISLGAEWNALLKNSEFQEAQFWFNNQGEMRDLLTFGFDPDKAQARLAEGGYPNGQEIVLAFDESLPGMAHLAESIRAAFLEMKLIVFDLRPYNPDTADAVFKELSAAKPPLLILGGISIP